MPQDSAPDAGGEHVVAPNQEASLRERILRVATRMFAERGWRGTHVQDVAREAGCTKPALYYHFESKERLFEEVARQQLERFGERIQQAHARGSVRDRLAAGAAMVLRHLREDPHGLRVLYRAHRQPEEGQPEFDFLGPRRGHLESTMKLVREGIENGELRADLDPEMATDLLAGVVEHRLVRAFCDDEPIPSRFVERVVEELFRGFAA